MTAQAEHLYLSEALSGDERAFEQLTGPYRRELTVHCYRLLGSFLDAEDIVQETMLRAWRRLKSFEGRAPFRAWLYRIATNASFDLLDQRKRRSMPSHTAAPADPSAPFLPPSSPLIWLEPIPDEAIPDSAASPEARLALQESVSLAFLTTLQTLPARQRAVLILRDVLAWRAKEVAQLLGITESAANSALFRARKTLRDGYAPEEASPSPVTGETEDLLEKYVRAWEEGNIDGLVGMLRRDATFEMPPSPSWYDGRAAIGALFADSLLAGEARGRWRLLPLHANRMPAYAFYQLDPDSGKHNPFGIHVLSVRQGRIGKMIHFLNPALFEKFGCPPSLAG